MRKRIFRRMCGVAFLCVLLTCICVTGVLYKFSFDSMKTMIRDEAVYVVASMNNGDYSGLEATKATFTRITLVNPDGTVAFDSREDSALMGNHGDRLEIQGALQSGASEARRYSETLAVQTYYRAVRLQNGQVVRVSGDMDSVWVTVWRYVPYLLVALAGAAALSAFSAKILSAGIATPLNNINLDEPMANEVYGELSPLLRRMERQRRENREQMRRMEEQRREFDAITANMREGLIVLGKEAEVLSINPSAAVPLEIQGECTGRHILHLSRNEELHTVVEQGLGGKAGEAAVTIAGREYQVLCNPVDSGGTVTGAVVLLLDATEKHQAERMRREFTANVSHELKTPLTSISGFAELIRDGVAKPEDMPRFAGRIYNEAKRMIALVDDILRLSRLDEGRSTAPKPVEMTALCRQIVERLTPVAKEKGVCVEVLGEPCTVQGDPRILEEMIGNLCDNAIKYNRDGGRVDIAVREQPDSVVLSVSDTGIGIPREYHDRVFERFFRIDKSHSRETGGTGLGLSIVKHGAALHGARLELESEEGRSTTVRVCFTKHKE